MKATGIIRRIDELGRIVVPIEMRKQMGIATDDPVEFFVEGDTIRLKKYQPNCIFCGSGDDLVDYSGKKVCKECIGALRDASGK